MDRRSFLRCALLIPALATMPGCAGWEKDYIDEGKDKRDRRRRRREVDRVENVFDNLGAGGGY